jgi:NusA-like KH domain protein
MIKTIDMQVMRYINLFSKISKVSPKHCFMYNSMIVFVVPRAQVQRAIGQNSFNLKKVSEVIGKKIKVVATPTGLKDAEQFVSTIIAPAEIKNVEIDGEVLVINSAPQNKALLIGRNKRRYEEMKRIIKDYFGKELKIA